MRRIDDTGMGSWASPMGESHAMHSMGVSHFVLEGSLNYPGLRPPVGGYASFSSSLGRVHASMALLSLLRRIWKKGNLKLNFEL